MSCAKTMNAFFSCPVTGTYGLDVHIFLYFPRCWFVMSYAKTLIAVFWVPDFVTVKYTFQPFRQLPHRLEMATQKLEVFLRCFSSFKSQLMSWAKALTTFSVLPNIIVELHTLRLCLIFCLQPAHHLGTASRRVEVFLLIWSASFRSSESRLMSCAKTVTASSRLPNFIWRYLCRR